MKTLYLDLASHDGLLACVDEKTIVASHAIDHRIGDHELIPLFQRTMQEAGWRNEELTHVACVVGPGGFMSLRVAVAFANTLIHELKIPGVGVHLSELFFARIPSPLLSSSLHITSIPLPISPWEKGEQLQHENHHQHIHSPSHVERRLGGEVESLKKGKENSSLWLHSTKKNELFVRGFGEFAKLWPEATHVTTEEFLGKLSSTLPPRGIPPPFTGELIPEHEALIRGKGMVPVVLRPIEEVLPTFFQKRKYEQKLLVPWYGRTG